MYGGNLLDIVALRLADDTVNLSIRCFPAAPATLALVEGGTLWDTVDLAVGSFPTGPGTIALVHKMATLARDGTLSVWWVSAVDLYTSGQLSIEEEMKTHARPWLPSMSHASRSVDSCNEFLSSLSAN